MPLSILESAMVSSMPDLARSHDPAGTHPATGRTGLRLKLPWGLKDPLAATGILLMAMILLLALFGSLLTPYNPLQPSPDLFAAPSLAHPFGTDQFGRDVLSRVLVAFRLDLFIAVTAIAAAAVIGVTVGGVAGYVGGRVDDVFMRAVDIVQSFPMLILAMALVAILGVGLVNVILVTIIVNVAIFARLARSDILAKKRLDYVDAARCSGASPARILVVRCPLAVDDCARMTTGEKRGRAVMTHVAASRSMRVSIPTGQG